MKAKEVLKLLRITRPTLAKYVKSGKIKVKTLPNGYYDYNEEDVLKFINKDKHRLTCIYGRVSTRKQINDLDNQMKILTKFAEKNGYHIDKSFKDIASGISFKNRKQFFELLDLVIHYQVKTVIITHQDRLSRVGFDLFKYLFDEYHTEIIVVSDLTDEKTDETELFSEITSLLNSFTMESYADRKIF